MTGDVCPRGNIMLYNGGGRVRLVIGEEKTSAVVSRTALTILSPVFKAMLTGGFREASKDASEIYLPDDDPDALLFLLRIAHVRFSDLPKRMSLKELYRLAIACDKYDTIRAARPFIEKYVEPFPCSVIDPGSEGWLFIAWTFGLEELYLRVTRALVVSCRPAEEGISHGEQLIEYLLPPGADGMKQIPSYGLPSGKSYLWLCANSFEPTDYITETRHRLVDTWLARIKKEFEELCQNNCCAVEKSEIMVYRLKTYFGIVPCKVTVSDMDHFTLVAIVSKSRNLIPNGCNSPACVARGKKFNEFVQDWYYAPTILLKSF
jgi:BTB/POZ domain-containing protein